MNETTNELLKLILQIEKKLVKPTQQTLKGKLSPIQFYTLFVLSEKSMIRNELSTKVGISKQQLTPIIDKLLECRFIMKKQDTVNKKSMIISLTDEGKAFLDDQRNYLLDHLKDQISKLDKDNMLSLEKIVIEMNKIMDKI